MKLNPYLNFNGDCATAFRFYEKHLGGQIVAMMPYAGSPMEKEMPEEFHDKIMHARLMLGDQALMGSDEICGDYTAPHGFHIALNPTDPVEAERVFTALAENGTVRMPLQETFWAVRFGMLTDQFGIPWMMNCEKAE